MSREASQEGLCSMELVI